ncbi:MAG: hypothetical protein FJX71_06205 [Alphaproteobacteria bacterium]|nr:hypothetical protein [Alphaproteobacteria bacterium]
MLSWIKKITYVGAMGYLLLAHSSNAAEAQDRVESESDRSRLVALQNVAYAKTLFVDSVMKNVEFQAMHEKYKTLDPLSPADLVLETQMKEHYKRYCAQCKTASVLPFVPSGPLSFLAAGLEIAGARQFSVFEEMDSIVSHYNLVGHTPPFKLSELFKMINSVLIPQYREFCTVKMKKAQLDLEDAENREVLRFLLEVGEDDLTQTMSDPTLLIIAARLLGTSPTFTYDMFGIFQHEDQWQIQQRLSRLNMQMLQAPFPGFHPQNEGVKNPCLLYVCGGFAKGEIIINLEQLRKIMKFILEQPSMHGAPDRYGPRINEVVWSTLNRLFYINGKQAYTFENDAQTLGMRLTKWFRILHKLSMFEKRAWKRNAEALETFSKQAEYVMRQLSSTDAKVKFSGVTEGPYTLALTRTTKAEQAMDKGELTPIVNERLEAHRAEVDRHHLVKPFAGVLKQTVAWLNDITDSLKKDGRMS